MRLFWPTVDMLLDVSAWKPPLGLYLRPSWFRSLGRLPRSATLDTDRLAVLGAGPLARAVVFQQGPREPEVAIFTFDGGDLESELVIRGERPVALLLQGSAHLSGSVQARTAGARAGGPGLGRRPGVGGGFGGAGGAPGSGEGSGASYGLAAAFEVGSGGQSAAGCGGAGGGGIQIGADRQLRLGSFALDVAGFTGGAAERGVAGGGGSGGCAVLHGSSVYLDPATTICVGGGAGGPGRARFGAQGAQGAHGGGGGGGGFVLGLTDAAGVFDPNGARFSTAGGRGGAAGPGGLGGETGGRGVAFLAAKRGRVPPRARRLLGTSREGFRARHAGVAAGALLSWALGADELMREWSR